MEHVNWSELLKSVSRANYLDARRILETAGVDADTIVLREDWQTALKVRSRTYNPDDLGAEGKLSEIEYRLKLCKASAVRWSFFRAHTPGRSDTFGDKRRVEHKSGAGDWYTAEGTYDRVLAVMTRSTKRLRWATDYFTIHCTYAQLCEYLAQYNEKGLATWFPESKSEQRLGGDCLIRLQEWKTSKKKIQYLQACPYNRG